MQIQQNTKYRTIYEVAMEIGTTPAGLRSLIAARKIPAEKVRIKKGVRPVNVFTASQEQIVRDYFNNRKEHLKHHKVIRRQTRKAEQIVYDIKDIQEVPFMAQILEQNGVIWARETFDKDGHKIVSFDYIELQKLMAHVNMKVVTDHPRIGFCIVNHQPKQEGAK